MDDSISVLAPNKVAVHIADPTSFIPLGSDLDFNASLRCVSVGDGGERRGVISILFK